MQSAEVLFPAMSSFASSLFHASPFSSSSTILRAPRAHSITQLTAPNGAFSRPPKVWGHGEHVVPSSWRPFRSSPLSITISGPIFVPLPRLQAASNSIPSYYITDIYHI
ncbi:hypothetical protein M011DRAFT_232814 [Sporormia fimetaria CBS 119925]|uniref:Uncharacterized protein n=1 Tax=Sporormia fimetaria CBS 119925 TaxID=1340428 RepID=A0A6A6VKW6_9PLEO|nr:hypothetical protein M011DRAFT_232814 [Sporormia fimetaria CBS 119925]